MSDGTNPDLSNVRTAAILIGASEWPGWQDLDSATLRGSHSTLERILPKLGITTEYTLDLFDEPLNANVQLMEIHNFLTRTDFSRGRPSDVVIYYIGHGDSPGIDNQYYLYVAKSSKELPRGSAISAAALAEAVSMAARFMRIYLIIDACYAGAAVPAFAHIGGSQGVALLLASSREDAARAPQGALATAFTKRFVQAVRSIPPSEPRSLSDLNRQMISARASDQAEDNEPHPQIHNPTQRRGPVSELRIFGRPGGNYQGGDDEFSSPIVVFMGFAAIVVAIILLLKYHGSILTSGVSLNVPASTGDSKGIEKTL
ncbi:hypothetical protein, partial [Frankia sp. AgB1.8]